MEAIGVFDASAALGARIQRAVADLYPAVGSGESVGARAMERVDAVDARASVGARLVLAVVGTRLAMLALEPLLADARERLARVQTRGAVVARMRVARETVTCFNHNHKTVPPLTTIDNEYLKGNHTSHGPCFT